MHKMKLDLIEILAMKTLLYQNNNQVVNLYQKGRRKIKLIKLIDLI